MCPLCWTGTVIAALPAFTFLLFLYVLVTDWKTVVTLALTVSAVFFLNEFRVYRIPEWGFLVISGLVVARAIWLLATTRKLVAIRAWKQAKRAGAYLGMHLRAKLPERAKRFFPVSKDKPG
jgi:hypothetical protein